MSTDWREKEREFLLALKADTGRDLSEWMRVISAQNLPHRNDIIDFLRQQGFMFARASWLERIHHNAGCPIYLDPEALVESAEAEPMQARKVATAGGGHTVFAPAGPPPPRQPSPPEPRREPEARPQPRPRAVGLAPPAPTADNTASGDAAVPIAPPPPPANPPVTPARTDLDDVLAKAKAYRPLAAHLIKALEKAVPGLALTCGASHIDLTRADCPIGLIAVSAKDIRLVLRDCGAPPPAQFVAARLPVTLARPSEGLPLMAVLTDARQIDEALINHVKRCAGL